MYYVTVQGIGAGEENETKSIEMLVDQSKNARVIVMCDINGHIGVLGEEVNGDGQFFMDFAGVNALCIQYDWLKGE